MAKITGTAGSESLTGTLLDDLIYGLEGDDLIAGDAGNDELRGGYGNDSIFGGAGNDLLMGGSGRDLLTGGSGADLFRFAEGDFAGATLALADVISDFNAAEGDRIDLSAIDAVQGIGEDAFRFLGNAAFSGAGGELRTTILDGYLVLEGDTTRDGIADFAIRLDALTTLSVGAIIV